MIDTSSTPEELSSRELIELLTNLFHRLILHHALWFSEVKHQLGSEKALAALENVFKTSFPLQLKKLSKQLGFAIQDNLPQILLNLPREKILELIDTIAVNWLANDGIWFQEVEFNHGMNDAKRCNDSCWAQFSPLEARLIKTFLGLPELPGLEGLKKALNFRLYGRINVQSISETTDTSFVFQMNECRVQTARSRKGLPDYPCKSVGLVEYPYFATAIDPRIVTECVGCPPDDHPKDWYCAWRFTLSQSNDSLAE
jgi:hypothetical protein